MEDQTINVTFPTPPAVNNLYFDRILPRKWPERPVPMVIRVLTPEGEEYKQLLGQILEGHTPFVGDVWITLRWYRPRRVGDLDNIFKVILDGMTGFVYNDDKQVARIHADRFEDAKRPRVELEIRPLNLC